MNFYNSFQLYTIPFTSVFTRVLGLYTLKSIHSNLYIFV
nr:MAG TPA: hypothetical protein [Caudoviricetes sp.]